MINHYGYDIFIIMYLFPICNDNAIATALRHPVYSVAYLRYALYVLSDCHHTARLCRLYGVNCA